MGKLQDSTTGELHPLRASTLVGRSRVADLHVADPRLSGQHALVRWTGGAWELRDLGSRNGTFHQGRRVAAGERVTLSEGDRLGLGVDDGRFVVAELYPPTPLAVADDGEVAEAQGGLIGLPPDVEPPELLVYLDPGGAWVCERDGVTAPAEEVVEAGGRRWRLDRPFTVEQTIEANTPSIDTIRLRFRVSRDEEYAQMIVLHGARAIELEARVHHYLLLTLARQRAEDREAGEPPESQGWVTVEGLARMLRMDEGQINLQVFRARKELAASGIEEAARLVERRSPGRQLRLGVEEFEVVVV